MAKKKKPYIPSPWACIKPKEDDRRKLTLFIAGIVPSSLQERLDKLTANYDLTTVMCAEGTDFEEIIKDWARKRRQRFAAIPKKDLDTFAGWMQFMQPDGNRAVMVWSDSDDKEDVKFAETLSKEEDVQFRKTMIQGG